MVQYMVEFFDGISIRTDIVFAESTVVGANSYSFDVNDEPIIIYNKHNLISVVKWQYLSDFEKSMIMENKKTRVINKLPA